MARNLVVLSDGTGNSAASSAKTNVWRLYQALDLKTGDQIASFDDGVGTSSFKPMQLLGLALGVGLKRNVLDLYMFLCRNYREGDRIHAFGFSRGAFTIQVLLGLIEKKGLVPYVNDEELVGDARAAYRSYRNEAFKTGLWHVRALRWARDKILSQRKRADDGRKVEIAFVGLWDTVAAYGMPIDELTIAIDRWVWPMRFTETRSGQRMALRAPIDLAENVLRARHALALDDQRRSFHPIPWWEKQKRGTANLREEKFLQVWFAGMHANVGGGYPDDRLAHVSLVWMIDEIGKSLTFTQHVVDRYRSEAAMDGRMYDSRAGGGVFFRYHPRSLETLMGAKPTNPPLLHASVVQRMVGGSDRYAPFAIDCTVEVLDEHNRAIPLKYAAGGTEKVQTAINELLEPEKKTQTGEDLTHEPPYNAKNGSDQWKVFEFARDSVWWRRLLYFVMLGCLLLLPFLPFLGEPEDGFMKTLNDALGDILSPAFGLLGLVLPGFAKPWLDAAQKNATAAAVLGLMFALAHSTGNVLKARIDDWMAAAWRPALAAKAKQLSQKQKSAQIRTCRRLAIWAWTAAALAFLAAWRFPEAPEVVKAGTNVALVGFGLGVVLLVLAGLFRLHQTQKKDDFAPWWTLGFARSVRNMTPLVNAHRYLVAKVYPAIFLLAAFGIVGFPTIVPLASQAIFQARVLVGPYGGVCKPSGTTQEATGTVLVREPFLTSNPCWASGVQLRKDQWYEIELTIPDDKPDWFDRTLHSDLRGLPTNTMPHAIAFLGKRWWGQNWFQPIARIGASGATEIALLPVIPQPPAADLSRYNELLLDRASVEPDENPERPIDERTAKEVTLWYMRQGQAQRTLRSEIKATKDGELFLYVNDSVPLLSSFLQLFDPYRNNTGEAWVSVRRLPEITKAPAAASPPG